MMATVPHVTSGSGLRKFQADGFSLTRVYVADIKLSNEAKTPNEEATRQRADSRQVQEISLFV